MPILRNDFSLTKYPLTALATLPRRQAPESPELRQLRFYSFSLFFFSLECTEKRGNRN
jgi:hypothetical protein